MRGTPPTRSSGRSARPWRTGTARPTARRFECIDAIKAACGEHYEGYLQGNAMKYLWRYRLKGRPYEDLQKAAWYVARLAAEVRGE